MSCRLFFILLTGWLCLCGAQPPNEKAQGADSAQQAAPSTKPPAPPVPSIAAEPTPKFTPYPDYQTERCYRAENHDASDLCAQWRSAVAAEKTAHEARRAGNWSVVATFLSGFAVIGLLVTICQSKRALERANEANEISREAMMAENRAWLSVQIQLDKGLVVKDGIIRTRANSVIKNEGGRPANAVGIDIHLVSDFKDSASRIQKEVADKYQKSRGNSFFPNITFFPGQRESYGHSLHINKDRLDEIRQAHKPDEPVTIPLAVVGSVQYSLPGETRTRQTGFNYIVHAVIDPVPIPTFVIPEAALPIEANKLSLVPSVEGPGIID